MNELYCKHGMELGGYCYKCENQDKSPAAHAAPSEQQMRVCPHCHHVLKGNNHGLDQNDGVMDGEKFIHSGECTYCRECNPFMFGAQQAEAAIPMNASEQARAILAAYESAACICDDTAQVMERTAASMKAREMHDLGYANQLAAEALRKKAADIRNLKAADGMRTTERAKLEAQPVSVEERWAIRWLIDNIFWCSAHELHPDDWTCCYCNCFKGHKPNCEYSRVMIALTALAKYDALEEA